MKRLVYILISAILMALLAFFGVKYVGSLSPRQTEKSQEKGRITVEELSYLQGNQKVFGKLYRPEMAAKKGTELSKKKLPIVVFCHGLSMTAEYWNVWCNTVASHGIIAYSFDFQGGSMTNPRSTGDMLKMTPKSEEEDLAIVIHRLTKEKFVDQDSIYVVGHDLGGLVASNYACTQGKKLIKGLVLMAPSYNLPDTIKASYSKPRDIGDTTIFSGCALGKEFVRNTSKMDPYKKIANFDNPVLIIAGDRDEEVPIAYLEKAAEAFPKSQLHVIGGGDHLFSGAARADVLERILKMAGR